MSDHTGTMLVVDDEMLNRTLLSVSLQSEGYAVETAENGQEALGLLRERSFDVILLDLLMPEMDGFEVLSQLKADPQLRRIPVIIISALDDMDSVIRCIEMGATDYLSKPFDPVLLRARVNASLASKRLHDMEVELLHRVQTEKQRADDLLNIVIPIGVALTGERDFNQLIERILVEAMSFCNADAGNLYMRTDDKQLTVELMRNRSLQIALGGTTGQPVSASPIPLYVSATGEPDERSALAYAALTGETVNIADISVEDSPYDFAAVKASDINTGYRTVSLLISPLKNSAGRVIGVLELINAQTDASQSIPFDRHIEQMIGSLSLLAAVALDAYGQAQQLRQQVAQLQIEIDQAKAARQVAEITETDYFQELQQEARALRGQGHENSA